LGILKEVTLEQEVDLPMSKNKFVHHHLITIHLSTLITPAFIIKKISFQFFTVYKKKHRKKDEDRDQGENT